MTVEARVLKIDNKKTLFGILDRQGRCGSGSCDGCSCSRKLKTITLPTPAQPELSVGMNVIIQQSGTQYIHFFLMLVLPLLLLLGIQLVAAALPRPPEKSLLNLLSLAGGLAGFVLAAVMIRYKGQEKTLKVTVKES